MVSGQLAALWPPLVAGTPTESGTSGGLAVVHTGNGRQVTYNGHFLYTFVEDNPGQVTGQGVQNFFVATPGLSSEHTAPRARRLGHGPDHPRSRRLEVQLLMQTAIGPGDGNDGPHRFDDTASATGGFRVRDSVARSVAGDVYDRISAAIGRDQRGRVDLSEDLRTGRRRARRRWFEPSPHLDLTDPLSGVVHLPPIGGSSASWPCAVSVSSPGRSVWP